MIVPVLRICRRGRYSCNTTRFIEPKRTSLTITTFRGAYTICSLIRIVSIPVPAVLAKAGPPPNRYPGNKKKAGDVAVGYSFLIAATFG